MASVEGIYLLYAVLMAIMKKDPLTVAAELRHVVLSIILVTVALTVAAVFGVAEI